MSAACARTRGRWSRRSVRLGGKIPGSSRTLGRVEGGTSHGAMGRVRRQQFPGLLGWFMGCRWPPNTLVGCRVRVCAPVDSCFGPDSAACSSLSGGGVVLLALVGGLGERDRDGRRTMERGLEEVEEQRFLGEVCGGRSARVFNSGSSVGDDHRTGDSERGRLREGVLAMSLVPAQWLTRFEPPRRR